MELKEGRVSDVCLEEVLGAILEGRVGGQKQGKRGAWLVGEREEGKERGGKGVSLLESSCTKVKAYKLRRSQKK